MADLPACDANLADCLVKTIGGADRRRATHPGLELAASEYDNAFFNAGVALAPGIDLAAATDFFGDLPFRLWVRDGIDDGITERALGHGLAVMGGPPLMVLDETPEPPPPPDDLDIAVVTTADLPDVVMASARGNGLAPHLAEVFAFPGLVEDPETDLVVGRVEGEAVATALAVTTGDAVGIYAVATVPEHRGKGYGAAVTWAAVEAGRRRGGTWSLLQTSDMGRPVYERMGYEVVGRYRFVSPPGA